MRKPRAPLLVVGASAVAVALMILLWVAFTGPGQLVTGNASPQGGDASAVPTSASQPSASPTGQVDHDRRSSPASLPNWLGELFVIALLLALGLALWWSVPRLIERFMWERPGPVEPVEIEPPRHVVLGERIVSARDDHLERLAEGTPRNGIVRCWIALEETAAGLGLPPRATETSTEFLIRMLHALDVDPRPPARLAELYHVARFSSHPLTEDDRTAARQALLALHAELGVGPADVDIDAEADADTDVSQGER